MCALGTGVQTCALPIFDPKRSLLSERHQGTFADKVIVPRRNVIPKPASMSFEEAACLPTAWLTAYRMLYTQGGLKAGDSVLVQGAGGGAATALIVLARAGGLKVDRKSTRLNYSHQCAPRMPSSA